MCHVNIINSTNVNAYESRLEYHNKIKGYNQKYEC